MIRRVEDDLRARTQRLLDAVEPGEPFDFLVDVAAELPMQMICILLGVPESERHWLFEAIEPQFDFGGSRKASVGQLSAEEAGSRMYTYGQELIAAKRAHPTDDMLSVVANASDAELSELELYLFFSLLFSAGARRPATPWRADCSRCSTTPRPDVVAAKRFDAAAVGCRRDGALDVAFAVEAAHRHAGRFFAGWLRDRGRAEGAGLGGIGQPGRVGVHRLTCSTSAAHPIRIWASGRASTTASARTWRAWNCVCCSRNC